MKRRRSKNPFLFVTGFSQELRSGELHEVTSVLLLIVRKSAFAVVERFYALFYLKKSTKCEKT